MKLSEIKIELSEIINFDYDCLSDIKECFKRLDLSLDEYKTLTCDLATLERLKISISGELVYLSKLFGEVKKFKGSNHTYLEDARKRVKAMCMIKMNTNISASRELVYAEEEFIRKVEAIEFLKKQFIIIEELFTSYERVFNAILQSISKETKQFQGI